MNPIICPKCKSIVPSGSKFCPQCGNPLVDISNQSLSLGKQIGIYSVCLLAPPFGLIYTFKYAGKANPQLRNIGIAALILTGFSIAFTAWSAIGTYHYMQNLLQTYVGTSY